MRAGVFQCDAAGLTATDRLEKLDGILQDRHLDLVVCPELYMSGYRVGDTLLELAESADGPFAQAITALARKHNVAIAYGYPERAGGNVYNAAACIDAGGRLVANHRKLLCSPGFESGIFAPGRGLTIFELQGFRFGMLICYDVEFPETTRRLAELGAQAVVVPTALARRWDRVAHCLVPSRAFENGIWLVYANHGGRENDLHYLGASCIIDPEGRDAARAGSGEELIEATLDPRHIVRARRRLPYVDDVRRIRGLISSVREVAV